jgi:hypothetical protein
MIFNESFSVPSYKTAGTLIIEFSGRIDFTHVNASSSDMQRFDGNAVLGDDER